MTNQNYLLNPANTGPLELLVLQSTPFCNLDCKYCYLPDRLNKSTMSLDMVEIVLQRLFETDLVDHQFTIVWHAGEPMVAGINYYQSAIDLINLLKPEHVSIRYSFQTNGVLINEAWCKFFRDNAISLGVSVDGPAFIHDRNRQYRNGAGSHKAVQAGIDLLNKQNIPFHTISVLSDYSLDYAEQIHHYFTENVISRVGFNIEEIESANKVSSLDNQYAQRRVKKFFTTLMQLNQQSKSPLSIRELNKSMSIISKWDASNPDWLKNSQELIPYKIISVDYAGNFSTFSPELLGTTTKSEQPYVFGNLNDCGFYNPTYPEKLISALNKINAGIKKCQTNCEYFQFCGGGSPSNKLYENKSFDSDETMYCRLHKKIPFEVTLDYLEKHAR